MNMKRRDFIKIFPVLATLAFAPKLLLPCFAQPSTEADNDLAPKDTVLVHGSNFHAVYMNDQLRERFYLFLKNVYSIYPDKKFHALIHEITQSRESDEEVYKEIQSRLPEITPFLPLLRYSLPSLSKQKDEMARQVALLMADKKTVVNYVEIGTPGRYVHGLEKNIQVQGETYILNTQRPSYSAGDIAERGQITRVGQFVDMKNYDPVDSRKIPSGKIELVSNFIGFHHAPPEKRNEFIKSVSTLLPSGGRLILRDHDVDGGDMAHMVALAHDVFNAGLSVPWEINAAEIRNFTSIPEIEKNLNKYGLERQGNLVLQEGDPTRNALMVFIKT
jgi:hypothetical protein